MTGMNNKVNEWIDAHMDELVNDIKDLCSIASVNGEPVDDMPFGEKACQALNRAMELAKKYGFETKNYDNYVATADFDSSLPHTLDVLGHTDVVPAGEGWTVTEPFNVIEKDGKLFGRGTSDDKGPLLCALYAMRAIKETGTPLSKGVRLIMGSDEETGSSDIRHYYEKEDEAPYTFSPDAEFPIINIEKGQFRGTLSKDYKKETELPRLLSLDAGVAFNAVPQKARLKFEGLNDDEIRAAADEIEAECGVSIQVEKDGEVEITGQSAHASTPETGKNAGLAAVLLINKLPLSDGVVKRLLLSLSRLFPYGVTDGSGIGIDMRDEESHDLTCTLDLFHVDETHMEFTFDSRTPIMANKENCEDKARKSVENAGFDWSTPGMIPPHAVAGDSSFVKTLLSAYEEVTGLKGECLAIGGGTYVHDLKNGVAFGAILPGVDTHMHGADEFIDIENLKAAAKVYANAIEKLCG